MTSPLTFVALGCGARADAYLSIALDHPKQHRLVAVADPVAGRRRHIASLESGGGVEEFSSAEELLERPRMAEVALVATQDRQHFEHARVAMGRGYDLLLEKPAAASSEEVEELHRLARQLGRKVVLCFVLRYTPFYQRVKEVVDSGKLGDLVSIDMVEGVGAWHFGHSFVRGHWAVEAKSSPMIVAKCCHDTDVMQWLVGSPCREVASRSHLEHFHAGRAPVGAPERCTDGCPVAGTCAYNAVRYAGDKREPWLTQVMTGAGDASEADILAWLKESCWGRCVYRSENDAPDHQVAVVEFASGVTGTLTLTAFDLGRRIRIHGTAGVLTGGLHVDDEEFVLQVRDHDTGEIESLALRSGAYGGGYPEHGGGDGGLVETLYPTFRGEGDPARRAALLDESVEGHRIAFAAASSAAADGVPVLLEETGATPGDGGRGALLTEL